MPPAPQLTRRQMFGVGAAAAAGVAALPVVGYEVLSHMHAPAASGAWPSPLASPRARAAHLLRRAGFGATSAELDAAQHLAYPDLVEQLLSQAPQAFPAPRDVLSSTASVVAWYAHMASTSSPFVERMTLFWHGLLTSDRMSAGPLPLVLQQNSLYRTHAVRDLRSLLLGATYDPLMMRYLNLDDSTAAAPNENYSRELMELFTLGPGAYTEADVREGARALSGIRILVQDANGDRVRLPSRRGLDRQQYLAALRALLESGLRVSGRLSHHLHDQGTKTFLGRTGNLGPNDVMDAILAQPWCATHIAARALSEFCMPSPPDSLVQQVATPFRRSGYDIRTLMRSIFLSDAFVSPQAYRALLRPPAHLVVTVMRLMNLPRLASTAARAAAAMGQDLYNPPNVGGWRLNGGWVSSGAWIARLNFAAAMSSRFVERLPDPEGAMRDQLDSVLTSATSRAFATARTAADRWYVILASPEFHML